GRQVISMPGCPTVGNQLMPPDAPLWESRLLPQGNACTSRIAHNKIDLKQHKKLRAFKQVTYKKALTGSFSTVDGLRQTLLRDLLRQFGALASITCRTSGRRRSKATARTRCPGADGRQHPASIAE
ncbi:MAG: hypothetical protein WCE53_13875, partial [Candidatus Acidiferrum sp.]